MSLLKYVMGIAVATALTACGGGGGSAGTTGSGTIGDSGSTTTGDTQTTAAGSVSVDLLNGSGVSTQSISAIEIAQVKVTVKDAKNALVSGTIVSFSESGPGLLQIAPASLTAMTNSQGVAVMEVRAADATKTGATTIAVNATVSGTAISAVKNMEVTNAPVSGGVDPQLLASSINFLSTDPADKSIVLAGAGGNGRSETGVLKFRVVDKNNTPVKGVLVDFVVNPSTDVTLNISQASTDADGVVITSVSSKTVATAVVVKATVNGKNVTTQSDQLKVTTGVGVAAGFEILPLVYNLDGALSGDSTTVTARLVDSNSNPVADGVPVVFVATGGKIGTSSAGGCNTLNGACTVTFEVQNPRPVDGIVKITGSAKTGESTTLLREISLNMSSATVGVFEVAGGVPATPLTRPAPVNLTLCNKTSRTYMVSNSIGYSAPSGTTVAIKGDTTTGLGASIDGGSTVLDDSGFGPSELDVIIDPSSATNPACNSDGIDIATGNIVITTNAGKSKRETNQSIAVSYPAGNLLMIKPNTAGTAAAINIAGCNYETIEVNAIGSDGLTLPVGAQFFVASSLASAQVSVSTVQPNTDDPLAPTNQSNTLGTASSNTNRQSLWLRVRAPNQGVGQCSTSSTAVGGAFTVDVTIRLPDGRRNTQSLAVTYPVAAPN